MYFREVMHGTNLLFRMLELRAVFDNFIGVDYIDTREVSLGIVLLAITHRIYLWACISATMLASAQIKT